MENLNSVAYIAKINEITGIEGADKIVLAKVEGWTSIVQKGIHKVGDLVLCITTDAVIPEKYATKWGVINYLRKGSRVRTVKLRGVYSECILIPLLDVSVYPKNLNEGQDMMESLGIFKYEPPVQIVHLPGGKTRKQKDNINFSKYYKFPNIKNVPNMFNEDDDVIFTNKIHGTNARYGIVKKTKLSLWDKIRKFLRLPYNEYEFYVGSHNVIKSSDSDGGFYEANYWNEIAQKYNIKEILWEYAIPLINANSLGTGIILYGEIYGPGVQGEKYSYNLNERQLALFDIEIDGQYVNRKIFEKLCTYYFQLPMVEKLYEGKYSEEIKNKFVLNRFIPGTKVPEEGIVISSPSGDRLKISKCINPEYLTFAEKNEVPDSH